MCVEEAQPEKAPAFLPEHLLQACENTLDALRDLGDSGRSQHEVDWNLENWRR